MDRARHKPVLISFSGLDGAGKTTQIENLHTVLASVGLRSSVRAFWDDAVVLARYREGFVHRVYRSERGVGAPGRPVARRDKNVRRWYLTALRHLLYLLDAINLRRVVARARKSGADAIIFDRYTYDELANLPLKYRASRQFARLLAWIAPSPDVAFFLDADPETAVARKPEYPLEFMRQCRASYHQLAELLRTPIMIPPLPLPQAKLAVANAVLNLLLESQRQESAVHETAPAA
jgi:thymidylate kinase